MRERFLAIPNKSNVCCGMCVCRKMNNNRARTGHQRGMGGRGTDDDDTHERHTDTNKLTRHTGAVTYKKENYWRITEPSHTCLGFLLCCPDSSSLSRLGGAVGGRAGRRGVCVCATATTDRSQRTIGFVLLTTKALKKSTLVISSARPNSSPRRPRPSTRSQATCSRSRHPSCPRPARTAGGTSSPPSGTRAAWAPPPSSWTMRTRAGALALLPSSTTSCRTA